MKEKFVACTCCGGLCLEHARIAHGKAVEPENGEVSGCWECCGTGCRACGNSGKIPLQKAMVASDRRIETLIKKVNDVQMQLSDERDRNEALSDWADGGKPPKGAVLR